MQKTHKIFFISLFFGLFLSACASGPVAYNRNKNSGTWQARVQVRDLKINRSEVLSLEVLSEKNQAMRLELTGAMGVRVASLLMKGEEISYAIHTQKKYYSGPLTKKSLRPLLKIDLDPRWLYSVFFDEPIEGWTCTNGANGLIEKCVQAGHEISWSERAEENKRVVIKGDNFEVNVLVKDFATKVQAPDKAFTLESPETYKRYKLL